MTAWMLLLLLASGNPAASGNGEPGDEWSDQKMGECAVTVLIERARDGDLAMDEATGHGAEADAILERCRREMGQQEPKTGKE